MHRCDWPELFGMARTKDSAQRYQTILSAPILLAEVVGWERDYCVATVVFPWRHCHLRMSLYTAAISLCVCVQGVCTRVARVGGRCAVVWLASEWHRVVCAVCVMHMVLKVAPSSCIRSQSLIALLRFCCFGTHPLSPSPPPTHMHRSSFW